MLELNTAIHATCNIFKSSLLAKIDDRVSTPLRKRFDVMLPDSSDTPLSEQDNYKRISAFRLLSNHRLSDIKKHLLTRPALVRETGTPKPITIWGFSVKGIRAEGQCPKCKGKFRIDSNKGFICPTCLTHPQRFLIDFWHEGERIRRGTTLDGKTLRSFADAHALLRQAENEIDAHRFDLAKWREREKKEYNFKVLIMEWHRDKKDLLKTDERAESYVPMLMTYMKHYLIPFFGHMDVRDIRKMHTKEFKNKMSSMSPKKIDLGPKYRKNIMGALSHFFNCLIEDEVLEKKPKIPTIDVPEHDFEVISPETQVVLLEYIHEEHKPIFVYLFGQGCRPAEARALKWDCINGDTVTYKRTWSRRKLKETTKTKRIRKNYLFYDTREFLPPRRFPNDFVFMHGKKKKRPYSGDFLNKLFNRAVIQLNKKLEEVGDTFRLKIKLYEATKHSFGTYMLRTIGVSPEVLQKHFGHVKLEQTLKYTKFAAVDTFREIEEKNRKVISLFNVNKKS
jgi:integrase